MTYRCKDAPRDGRWILIQRDYNNDIEYWFVGRWNPVTVKHDKDNEHTYEWEFHDRDGSLDNLSDGKVCSWKELGT